MPDECKIGSNACDQCFRTKHNCSKHPIQCQRCAELGSSCTYSFGKFMGRPKKSAKSRRQFHNETDSSTQSQRENSTQINTSNLSIEGLEEIQNHTPLPTPLPTPAMKSNGTQSLDWWQSSQDDKDTSNYHSSIDDVESHSATDDKSYQTTSKQPTAPTRTSACDQCYRFKVKCTREPGCCQRCSLNGNTCTYSAAVDMVRSRKRSAPPLPIELSRKKSSLPSQTKSDRDMEDFGTSSTATDLHGNDSEAFYPKDITVLHPQTLHRKHQRSTSDPQNSNSRSTCQPPAVMHESTDIPDDNISFHEASQFYSNSPLSIPILDSFFENDNFIHNINYKIDRFEATEQSHGNDLPSKPKNLDPLLEKSVSGSCSCLQSALFSLFSLHSIVRSNFASSLDSIFAATRNGLLVCETLTLAQCSSCQPGLTSTLLIICVAILQQVHNAYELLSNPTELSIDSEGDTDKKVALSIKIGEMEFTDVGNSPSIMKAILKIEKARAEKICKELLETTTSNNQSKCVSRVAGKEEEMIQDSMIGLLEGFRGRFKSEVT
ncbi:hypothetical protein ACMFMG_012070 [Clarireedia jacksonii]